MWGSQAEGTGLWILHSVGSNPTAPANFILDFNTQNRCKKQSFYNAVKFTSSPVSIMPRLFMIVATTDMSSL